MDRDNKRWVSLHALVTFTLAEEERFNMKASSAPHVSSSKVPSQFPPSKPQWQSRKRGAAAVMAGQEGDGMDAEGGEGGPSGIASVVTPPAGKKAKADGAFKPKDPAKGPAKQLATNLPFPGGTVAVWMSKAADAPKYHLNGKSYQEMQKRPGGAGLCLKEKFDMHEHGLCWWCKKFGHAVDGDANGLNPCPLKNKPRPQ